MKLATDRLALAAILVLAPGIAHARQNATAPGQQSDSLTAAARAAREQKQQKPAPKVWDNDNLPKQGGVSVVGQEAPAPAEAAATPAGQAPASAPVQSGSKQGPSVTQADLDAAKKQLDGLKSDLDVQQRKYALDQQSYYGETNFEADKAGAAALRDEKGQIDVKQQELDDLQKKIDDMAAKVSANGAPSESESK